MRLWPYIIGGFLLGSLPLGYVLLGMEVCGLNLVDSNPPAVHRCWESLHYLSYAGMTAYPVGFFIQIFTNDRNTAGFVAVLVSPFFYMLVGLCLGLFIKSSKKAG